MPQTLAFSSSLITLKFSVHNIFETRVLLKIFDAKFPYKLSYFEPICLPHQDGGQNRDKVYLLNTCLVKLLHIYSYDIMYKTKTTVNFR